MTRKKHIQQPTTALPTDKTMDNLRNNTITIQQAVTQYYTSHKKLDRSTISSWHYFHYAALCLPQPALLLISQIEGKNKKNAPASVSIKEESMQFATQHNNPLNQVTSSLSFTNQQLNTITLYHITSPLAPFILDFNRMLQ